MRIDGSDDDKPNVVRVPSPTASLEKLLKQSTTSGQDIKEKAEDIFERVATQKKINIFIDEYVVTEDFINRIRRYARQEFDSMLLKVFIWFAGIAAGTVIAILLSGVLKK